MCHAQILGAAIVRARKDHRCSECGRAIPVGRTYERSRLVGDGTAWTIKLCRLCVALESDIMEQIGPGECWYGGDLVTHAHESVVGEKPGTLFRRLRDALRKKGGMKPRRIV